jgi:uncharacterized integral membrane protein (TIGR00698 family)
VSFLLSDYLGTALLGFDKSPISPVMIAILLGIMISTVLRLPDLLKPGLTFSVKKVLRLGIILLGIRLTIFDVFQLGAFGVPIVFFCIVGALLFTSWINKKLQLPERLGTLIAVGTSICGVTAIVATAPAIDADEDEACYAVATITIFGLFATLFYPYLANYLFDGQTIKAGLFLGTAVHETAQVVGAGKIFADIFGQSLTLDVATVAKLVRNVFMAAVIPIMAYYYAQKTQRSNEKKKIRILELLPAFILGFLLMAVFRSLGDSGINTAGRAFGLWNNMVWDGMINGIKYWAEIFLVAALAGVGLTTKLNALRDLGVKPFVVGLCASLSVGLISYLAITILGSMVIF